MRVLTLCVSFLALAASAGAQLFPPVPKSGTVYDGAHLLSASEIGTVNAVSQGFKAREGAPIVVATIPSLASVGAKAIGVERYATLLFDQWRIGRKERNVGILLLVAKDDHKMRVELGRDLGHDYDAAVHRIDAETILPAFKRGDYAGGIVQGVQALSHLPDSAPAAAASSPPVATQTGGPMPLQEDPTMPMNAPSPFPFDGGVLCFLVLIVLFVIVIAAASSRRRNYGGASRRFGSGFGPSSNTTYVNNTVVNNSGDDGFAAGLIAGEMMSQPTYDPGPSFDSGPSVDTSPSFDSGSSVDSGSSSDGGSFDSGSSGGGGDSGSW